jgi:hypothetical protein
MKKSIQFLSIALLVSLMACADKTTKKETIVVPSDPVIIVKDPPSKGTTITLNKKGVKVEAKKIEVKIDNK